MISIYFPGLMFYAIGRELFSGESPSGVYGKALKDCMNNTEVLTVIKTRSCRNYNMSDFFDYV